MIIGINGGIDPEIKKEKEEGQDQDHAQETKKIKGENRRIENVKIDIQRIRIRETTKANKSIKETVIINVIIINPKFKNQKTIGEIDQIDIIMIIRELATSILQKN